MNAHTPLTSPCDGPRLRELRKSTGRTQTQFAENLGVSQGFIGDVEAGRCGLSRGLIDKIGTVSDVDLRWLLGLPRPGTFIPEQASEGAGARQNGAPSDTGAGGVGASSAPIFSDPDFWDRQMARGPLEWVQDWAGVVCLLILLLMAPFALPLAQMLME